MSLITIDPCSKMYTWATISNLWTNKSVVGLLGPLERLERQEFRPGPSLGGYWTIDWTHAAAFGHYLLEIFSFLLIGTASENRRKILSFGRWFSNWTVPRVSHFSIYFLNNSIEHETHRCHISQIPENDFHLKSSFIQINWNSTELVGSWQIYLYFSPRKISLPCAGPFVSACPRAALICPTPHFKFPGNGLFTFSPKMYHSVDQ